MPSNKRSRPLLSRLSKTLCSLCWMWMLSAPVLAERGSEAQLKEVKAEIEQLKEWLDNAKGQQSELQQKLKANEKTLSELNRKVQKAQRQLNKEEARLKKLQSQRTDLNLQLFEQESRLARQLELVYRWQPQGFVKAALGADRPGEAARRIKYLSYLNQARMRDIESYRNTLSKVREVQTSVQTTKERLAMETHQLEQGLIQIRQQQRERSEVLKKLRNTIANKDDELRTQEKQRQRLEALLAKVERVLEQYPQSDQVLPFVKRRGQLPQPTQGTLVKGYDQGLPHEGKGWLIRGQEGDAVRAVHHGRVVFADWLRGYGLLVIVDHGQGYMTLYARNQSLLKTEGEWVTAGDTVATLGRSGGYDQPMLYFEIRHKGKPLNPRTWVARK